MEKKIETRAIDDLMADMTKHHSELKYIKKRLIIDPEYPYFGASPDGVVECSLFMLRCQMSRGKVSLHAGQI